MTRENVNKDELLNQVNKKKWAIASTPAYLLPCVGWTRGFILSRKYFRESLKELILAIREDGLASQISDEVQMFQNIKELYDFPEKTREIISKWKQSRDAFFKKWSRFNTANGLVKLTDKELGEQIITFTNDQTEIWAPPLQADSLGIYSETELFDQFLAALSSEEKKHSHEIFAKISQMSRISFTSEERLSILKLSLSYQQNSTNFETQLSEHQAKYFWIKNTYRYLQDLPTSYFLEIVKKESVRDPLDINQEIENLKNWPAEGDNNRKEFFANRRMDPKLADKLLLTPLLGDWLDERKSFNLRSNHIILMFSKEAAKRVKLNVEEIYCLRPEEIQKILTEKTIDRNELDRRLKWLVYVTAEPNREFIFSGEEAREIIYAFDNKAGSEKNSEKIKGMVASRGSKKIYRGKTRIVHDIVKDRFEDGEILVTSSTRPEFVPLMRKALCIVTDEGGIASHASIVSRELGKPCVIGTKVATKILKDGDLVEVDVESGIIKIIK